MVCMGYTSDRKVSVKTRLVFITEGASSTSLICLGFSVIRKILFIKKRVYKPDCGAPSQGLLRRGGHRVRLVQDDDLLLPRG